MGQKLQDEKKFDNQKLFVGVGHSAAQEFLNNLDCPGVTFETYQKREKVVLAAGIFSWEPAL